MQEQRKKTGKGKIVDTHDNRRKKQKWNYEWWKRKYNTVTAKNRNQEMRWGGVHKRKIEKEKVPNIFI